MSEAERFEPEQILGRLVEAEVRFVVIGGLAAQAHGSTSITRDLDICFDRDEANVRRLTAALRSLSAKRSDATGSPNLSALKRAEIARYDTPHGRLDLIARPDFEIDFDRLVRGAITTDVDGHSIKFAALDDVIAMKRLAGRPKDRVELEILGALREEIDRRQTPVERRTRRSSRPTSNDPEIE